MLRVVSLLVSLGLAASSLSAQQPPVPPGALTEAVSSSQSGVAVKALQIGDVLRVAVWREPTLSGDFPVDQAGYVTLPMLGTWRVSGTQWPSLRDSLLAAYHRELRTESIVLVPMRRVYMLGSVLRPGLYMLDPTMGLESALALAGGAGLDGNLEHIRVMRDGKELMKRIPLNATLQQYDVRSGDQLYVQRRSWLDRNSTLLLTSVISLAGIIVSIAVR